MTNLRSATHGAAFVSKVKRFDGMGVAAKPMLLFHFGGRHFDMRIIIENEDPNDDRSLFRIKLGDANVARKLTATQAHIVVGEVFERSLRRRNPNDSSRLPDELILTEMSEA
jgi:hypothetical protein